MQRYLITIALFIGLVAAGQHNEQYAICQFSGTNSLVKQLVAEVKYDEYGRKLTDYYVNYRELPGGDMKNRLD